MIKPEELRIGNWVQDISGNPFKIAGFEFLTETDGKVETEAPILATHPLFGVQRGHPLTWYLKDINPIPLTAEWLERMGYVKHPDGWYWRDWGTNGVEIIKWAEPYQKFAYELGAHRVKILDYVNQLQNLSFAITGNELRIKEK